MSHSSISRYWYWVLVLLEANIIGYWILGALFGIVLTLYMFSVLYVYKLLFCGIIIKANGQRVLIMISCHRILTSLVIAFTKHCV